MGDFVNISAGPPKVPLVQHLLSPGGLGTPEHGTEVSVFLSKLHTSTTMLSVNPTLSLTQIHPSVVRVRETGITVSQRNKPTLWKYKSDPNIFPSLSPKSPEATLPRGTQPMLPSAPGDTSLDDPENTSSLHNPVRSVQLHLLTLCQPLLLP